MSGLPTMRPCGREPVNPSALPRRNPVQLPISRLRARVGGQLRGLRVLRQCAVRRRLLPSLHVATPKRFPSLANDPLAQGHSIAFDQ
jgi:hypothetical protein